MLKYDLNYSLIVIEKNLVVIYTFTSLSLISYIYPFIFNYKYKSCDNLNYIIVIN